MFWNKKDEEIIRLRILLVENTAKCNEGIKRMESYVDLILAHLKLKYVPETETKEPAKLVEVEETEKVYMGFPLGYIDRPISKKSRPKKKK